MGQVRLRHCEAAVAAPLLKDLCIILLLRWHLDKVIGLGLGLGLGEGIGGG